MTLNLLLKKWYGNPKEGFSSTDITAQWTNVWFSKTLEIDADLIVFLPLLEDLIPYANDIIDQKISVNDPTKIALIILYDQIPRNIFRKSFKAYAYDHLSLQISKTLLSQFHMLPSHWQLTIIICLVHSEDINDHAKIPDLINRIVHQNENNLNIFISTEILNVLKNICQKHHERVCLFGRISERNNFLQRETSEKERAYMEAIY